MPPHRPRSRLATHEVSNQPPPFVGGNAFDDDAALREALAREGAAWAEAAARALGAEVRSERFQALAEAANRYPPELRAFDRFGHRLDEVAYHPAYHELMTQALAHNVHAIAWSHGGDGGHVAHAALEYLLVQGEAGICCPVTMTYAALPALRREPALAAEWAPRLLSTVYDPRALPATEKAGATMGMAMTEKQGGSDVRSNETRAVAAGTPGEYELNGHKWFCSAPMSDAFLTLAQAEGGLTCFLVPRWRPDGERNAIELQRLKDKLGDRSNASAEIEYRGAWARQVGDAGRGVATIIEMINHTRLDCAAAAAGLMRQALSQALHHARHRRAFQRRLVDQPLMRNVLADLALESEAATALALRVARGFDASAEDTPARAFARLAVAVAKYWLNKRVTAVCAEALECLGGAGFIEESPMPRLYRQAPVNGIWEGSGNVICLDVLRAIGREPAAADSIRAELGLARGGDARLDRAIEALEARLGGTPGAEAGARGLVETMALTLQGALLLRHAPAAVAEAFLASRLGGEGGRAFGALPAGLDFDAILARASVAPGRATGEARA